MTDEREPESDVPLELLELAYRVGDGDEVDWSGTRTGRPPLDAAIAQLHAIARIGDGLRDDAGLKPAPPGGTWGPMRLVERLQTGTFGEVWRAHDPTLQRDVALKLERHAGHWDQQWIDEGRRLARVRHPNVITVHGADRHGGRAGLWMDLVQGHTLEDVLRGFGPLGAQELVRVGIELCAAVAAVHAAGLVHGDIKTRNVMRAGQAGRDPAGAGRIVLMDFGSAREGSSPEGTAHTPMYAAPEVLRGGKPSVAADVYSVGVVLYRMATGRFPREAGSPDALATASASPLTDARPDYPIGLAQLVERCLHDEPAHRFPTARAVESALAEGMGASPSSVVRAVPRWRWAAVLVVGIVLGMVIVSIPSRLAHWTEPRFRLEEIPVRARLVDSLYGENTNDSLGGTMAPAGDVDGDGFDDFLVSAGSAESVRGTVLLLRGRADGLPAPWMSFHGSDPGDSFGGSLTAGDLNGDGYSDVVIGACAASGAGEASGLVRLWWGGPGLDEEPDLMWSGDTPNEYLGYALDASGDLDGDGYADLCVGAPLDERAGLPTGRAYVYRGGPEFDTVPDLDLTSASSYSQFGIDVATGDFNGDGFDDLIVGANWENTDAPLAGRAYVYLGGRSLDATPDLIVRGPFENAMLGHVASLGDIDEDGLDDWVVGHAHPSREYTQLLRLYRGASQLDARSDLELAGPAEDDGFGTSFGPAGDFDGDGHPDFFVGAPSHDEATRNAGALYLYRGGPELDAVADLELLGKGTWDLFGSAAFSFPFGSDDAPGPGLAVGASWASDHGRRAGRVDWFTFSRRTP